MRAVRQDARVAQQDVPAERRVVEQWRAIMPADGPCQPEAIPRTPETAAKFGLERMDGRLRFTRAAWMSIMV